MKKWRGLIIAMSILSLLAAIFTGCGNRENQGEPPENLSPGNAAAELLPLPLPEGSELKHLFITHQGMRAGSYYILKTTDSGTYMKITDLRPDSWQMLEGEGQLGNNGQYLGFADTVKDCERASLVLLEDEEPLRALEAAIANTGALGWDGFRESVAMPGVKDSGDRYRLYLELSEGTTVMVDGYNAKPAGFLELLRQVEEIFHANQDYSRYQIKDFDSSACSSLYVCFRSGFGKGEWRLELSSSAKQWIVQLTDPEGQLLEPGTDIADYQQIEGEIPFARFLELFKKHGAQRWNGYAEPAGNSEDSFEIRLYFEDGKEFVLRGSLLPEGFAEFRKEFVEEIHRFYNEQKS